MMNALLPLLLLAAAAGLWKIGFQRIPLLLVLGAFASALAALGVKQPEQVAIAVAVAGAALFFVGVLVYIVYLKLKTRADLRELEAARQRRSSS